MENVPISILLETAKSEMKEAVDGVRKRYSLRPCIMEVIVSAILADVRNEAKDEFVYETNVMLHEKEMEIEEVRKEAKKVLKEEHGYTEEAELKPGEVRKRGGTGKTDDTNRH